MRKPPRLTLIRRNSLLKVSKDTSAFRVTTLIQTTSMRFNQFIEDNYKYIYPPEDPDDYRSGMDDDHDLVADIDSDTLIMHQSIPSTNIPPGRPPWKFFKVVKNPAPGQNFSAKARPPGQENTYPRGVL